MDVVAFVVMAGAIAVALFINAYRWGRRGDMPRLLERAGLATVALFVGCMLFVDHQSFYIWAALLCLSLALLAAAGWARRVDETAQEQLIAGAGGPMRTRRMPSWLVALGAAALVAVPAAAAVAVVMQWANSLSSVGKAAPTPDATLAATLTQELQHLMVWLTITMTALSVLPLAVAAIAGWIQHRRRRAAAESFDKAMAVWVAACARSRTPEECAAFLAELENVRLAYRLGIAERRRADSLDQVLA